MEARPRWRPPSPLWVDAGLATVLAAVSVVEVWLSGEVHGRDRWVAAALLVAECGVLVARRRHPVAVWLAAGAVTSAYALSSYPDPTLHYGVMAAVYSVAAHTSRATAARAGAFTAASVVAVLLADWGRSDARDWVVTALTAGTAWLLGDLVRTHRAYAAEMAARAAELERRREDEARRAVADERVRLARELHDVTAHHVSVIAVQAEAGQALLPGSPERAAETLAAIATSARDALGELRRLLGVLRSDGDGDGDVPGTGGRVPQPGLDRLPALVEQVRAAGVPVDLRVEGDAAPVAAGVDVSAYRIVQEALTNVLRHAGGGRATVVVRYRPDAVHVEVVDDGDGAAAGAGSGLGLVGMRERAAMLGGHLDAGPRPGGGFAVRATLPR